eukprot:3260932-Amphidinium_carterae.1
MGFSALSCHVYVSAQATPRGLGPPAEKRAKTSVAVAAPRVVPLAPAPLLPTTAMAAQAPHVQQKHHSMPTLDR